MEDVAADGQPLHQVQDGGHPYLRLGFSFLNVYFPAEEYEKRDNFTFLKVKKYAIGHWIKQQE